MDSKHLIDCFMTGFIGEATKDPVQPKVGFDATKFIEFYKGWVESTGATPTGQVFSQIIGLLEAMTPKPVVPEAEVLNKLKEKLSEPQQARAEEPSKASIRITIVDSKQETCIKQACSLAGFGPAYADTILSVLNLRSDPFIGFRSRKQCKHFLKVIFPTNNQEFKTKRRVLGVLLAELL